VSDTTVTTGVSADHQASTDGRQRRLLGGIAESESRWVRAGQLLVLAVVAYVPQLMAQPGVVSSDTKTYLYLDITRFLPASASMWDPTVGLGTVTHQQIGYLLPMGPFYWLFHVLGVPLWISQRLWVGSILFAAGAGALYLCRTLGLGAPGSPVAAFAYMFSPYFLQYVGRISVLLLPWAGLPWLLTFTVLALRRGGWRDVARFGFVIALVGSINATSLIYVCVGPILWLAYSVVGLGESTWRRAFLVALKLGAISLAVSLWWIAGLAIEGVYGVDILRTTETVQTVSQTSTPIEVLRGLGYWYFYGSDRLGAWVVTSLQLTQDLVPLASGFAVAAVAVMTSAFTRWRYRAFFALLALVGLVLAVGVYPFSHPTWFGGVLKTFMTKTTEGLALRSTDRATPLLILSLAMLIGAGVVAAARRSRLLGLVVGVIVVALVAVANPPAWNGNTVADKYTQPASLPGYTLAAAKALNAGHPDTRVLGIPGSDFADYVYGDTTDPVYAAILDRSYISRGQLPQGGIATADLLYALDDPIQLGTADWSDLAPIASLMSAGDVLVQSNLNYAHYDQPQPTLLWAELQPSPPGLGQAICFGKPVANPPAISEIDEQDLAEPNLPLPCPLEVLSVANPRAIVRAEPTSAPLIVDGDAEGLVAAAGVGLLANNPTVLYAGTLDTHAGELRSALQAGAVVVVTDTNRKRAFRWDTIVDEAGQTLTPTQSQQTDSANSPIVLFPGAPASTESTADYVGVKSVTASAYGDTVTYLPEDRPFEALDGNLDTAWEAGAFGQPIGQWWQVALNNPTTTDAVSLVQPLVGARNRYITRATLTFDGGHPITVKLGPSSRTAAGQTIDFSTRTFSTLRIRVDATNFKGFDPNAGPSSVGLAEVRLADVSATELIDLPSDVLSSPAAATTTNRLIILLTRERVSPYGPRQDPEITLDREFTLPVARTFTLTGSARINALIPDDQIDRLTGRQQASGIVAYSKGRLPGDLSAGASSAIDGNPATAWSPGFGASSQVGSWIHLDLPKSVTFDHMDLQIVADGRHSIPTSITVATEQGTRTIELPAITNGTHPGATVTVPVDFPALTGRHLEITITGAKLEYTRNYYSRQLEAFPVGIAELGIPGVDDPPAPAAIPATCRDDLLEMDGSPIWVKVSGPSATALAGGAVEVSLCGPDAGGLPLSAGRHVLEAGNGAVTGWNVDELAFDSGPGGGPEPDIYTTDLTDPPDPGPAPAVTVTSQSATTIHLRLTGVQAASPAFHLVLGESENKGWVATVDGGRSLGAPQLIDGFANGWTVTPADLAGHLRAGTTMVTLRWEPQQAVWGALLVSAVAFAAALVVAFWPATLWPRRRSRRRGWPRSGPDEVALDGSTPHPALTLGLTHAQGRAGWITGALTAIAMGGVIAAVTRPDIGAVVGLAALVSVFFRRARGLLTWAGIALAIAAGVAVVVDQATRPAAPGGTWAPTFVTAARLAWAAVACLAADGAVEIARRVRTRRAASRTKWEEQTTPPALESSTPPPHDPDPS
jgi:hypothetical protein